MSSVWPAAQQSSLQPTTPVTAPSRLACRASERLGVEAGPSSSGPRFQPKDMGLFTAHGHGPDGVCPRLSLPFAPAEAPQE